MNVYDVESAVFVDEDRQTIMVNVKEGENLFTRVITVEPSPVFEEFVKQVSLDTVEENTKAFHATVKEEEEQFANDIVDRAVKEMKGEHVVSVETTSSNFDPNNLSTEDLFKLKLQSFEIEEVKTSKNRELKAKIRKANNLMEVIAFTAATILDNQ